MDKIIIDTNVWIYYLDRDSEYHGPAVDAIKEYCEGNYKIYITSQIIRELLVVLTGQKNLNKPLIPEQAVQEVNKIIVFTGVIFENTKTNERLKKLIAENQIRGKRIHDANIMAVAIENSIDVIRTNNPADFVKTENIKIEGLIEKDG